ncbi:MAG: ABC transporter permease [Acidimicrobiaceae bacterium]|nr:ABC transporter permease [Acidimicrobiaceae bacterium]
MSTNSTPATSRLTRTWVRMGDQRLLARLLRSPRGLFGLVTIVLLVLLAIFAEWLAPANPNELVGAPLQPPFSDGTILGTDDIGRDVFSNLVIASRASLRVGVLAAALAVLIGTVVGSIAGYFGGVVDAFLMRIAEMFQVVPGFAFAIVMAAVFDASINAVAVIIALTAWSQVARIVRAQFLSLRSREFVQAASVAGFSSRHIIASEVLPNALPPVLVQVALDVGTAILMEAGLSFLGVGDPNVPTWGQMLNSAQIFLGQAWWLSVFPGAAILLTVVAFNMLADGLNEALGAGSKR